jgi:hypothetical protein
MSARLITESDVRAGRITNPLVIEPGTLITPAALDAAFVRGIRVIYAHDRPRSTAIATPSVVSAAAAEPSAPPSDPPPACSCGVGSKRDTAIASAPTAGDADWVATFRRGKPRRFDSTPFRSTRGVK